MLLSCFSALTLCYATHPPSFMSFKSQNLQNQGHPVMSTASPDNKQAVNYGVKLKCVVVCTHSVLQVVSASGLTLERCVGFQGRP